MPKFLDEIKFIDKNGDEVLATSIEEVKRYVTIVNEYNIVDEGYTGAFVSPDQKYNGQPVGKWDSILKEYGKIKYVKIPPVVASEYNQDESYFVKQTLLDGTEYFKLADPQPTQENFSEGQYYIYLGETLEDGDILPGAKSTGPLSLSIGCEVNNNAPFAFVSGYRNFISDRGICSTTGGYNNINCGDGTAIFGASNIAEWTATDSFIGGSDNYATKTRSFTFGSRNDNQAQISAIFGQDNSAAPNAAYCFIAGVGNRGTEKYQVKIGSYCAGHGHALLEVGIGSDSGHKKNGLEVRSDGICIAGAHPSKTKPDGKTDAEYTYSLTTAGYIDNLLLNFGGRNSSGELKLNARNGNVEGSVIIGRDNVTSATNSLMCGVGLTSGQTDCQSNFGKFNSPYGNAALTVGWGSDINHPETIFYIGCKDGTNKGVVFSKASPELLDTVVGNNKNVDGVLITRQYLDYCFNNKNISFGGTTSFNGAVNFAGGINAPVSIKYGENVLFSVNQSSITAKNVFDWITPVNNNYIDILDNVATINDVLRLLEQNGVYTSTSFESEV